VTQEEMGVSQTVCTRKVRKKVRRKPRNVKLDSQLTHEGGGGYETQDNKREDTPTVGEERKDVVLRGT